MVTPPCRECGHLTAQNTALAHQNDALTTEINQLKTGVYVPNTCRITPCTRFWITCAAAGWAATGALLYLVNQMINDPARTLSASISSGTNLRDYFYRNDDEGISGWLNSVMPK